MRSQSVAGGTLVLTRAEVARFLDVDACLDAVDLAFRLNGTRVSTGPAVMELPGVGGGFHVKAGGLRLDRAYSAVKVNANFPGNPARGLPTIQGVLLLFDAEIGAPLAIMDSAEITALRTAAATALAARHLAKPEASVAAIIGCGRQSRDQLRFLARFRDLRQVFAIDLDETAAHRFAEEMTNELGIPVTVARSVGEARDAEIWITCTPSATPVLSRADVARGAFVAGVGADNPHKRELAGDLFEGTIVVPDILDQCLKMGDLRHAVAEGRLREDEVSAELGDVLAGRTQISRRETDITIFDSTGMALQDVAAAVAVYRGACAVAEPARSLLLDG